MFHFFKKIGSRLGQRIRSIFSSRIDESAFASLEKLFYESDLGSELSMQLVEAVRNALKKNPAATAEELLGCVRDELLEILGDAPQPASLKYPHVILIVGVNGSGKTTSLAKLAAHYRRQNRTVLIAAADTYRAAAQEQLQKWAEKTGAGLIQSQSGHDPSAVVFDALMAAKARDAGVVLIDTAGRLQTKTELMHELSKIRRTCQKHFPDAPHETLLVLDATIGQNALDQAAVFHSFTPLSGVILAKLDGSAKGGIAIAIRHQLKIPILWIGTGEGPEDLIPFDPAAFVDALLRG